MAANLAKTTGVPIPDDQDGEEPEAIETPVVTPKKRGKAAE